MDKLTQSQRLLTRFAVRAYIHQQKVRLENGEVKESIALENIAELEAVDRYLKNKEGTNG